MTKEKMQEIFDRVAKTKFAATPICVTCYPDEVPPQEERPLPKSITVIKAIDEDGPDYINLKGELAVECHQGHVQIFTITSNHNEMIKRMSELLSHAEALKD